MKVLHQVPTVLALWSPRVILGALLGSALLTSQAAAWGNEGHQIIADIAEQYLEPVALASLRAILDEDHDGLTAHDMADEAMWADRYRDLDRNGSRERYERTRHWHFVDIELDRPNLDRACFGHPRLPAGVPASSGPAEACIVDKIDQFAAELGNSETDPEERLVALKFVLHLVGDVHQPLHTADDHDAGGNGRQVRAGGLVPGKLHHFWDIEFVERLGRSPAETAARLIAGISDEQRRAWSVGTAADWAMESHALARAHAYGMLPAPGGDGVYALSQDYIDAAIRDVALQLSRAGIRLAVLLNRVLTTGVNKSCGRC